jgi:hypothetical protein
LKSLQKMKLSAVTCCTTHTLEEFSKHKILSGTPSRWFMVLEWDRCK